MKKSADCLSLSDMVYGWGGTAKIFGLKLEDGLVHIKLGFLENGVTWDGWATVVVDRQTQIEVDGGSEDHS